jgi:hypothetical protein
MYTDSTGMSREWINNLGQHILKALVLPYHTQLILDMPLKYAAKGKDSGLAVFGYGISGGAGKVFNYLGGTLSIQRVCSASRCETQFVRGAGFHSRAHLDIGFYQGMVGVNDFSEMEGIGYTITGVVSVPGVEIDYYPTSTFDLQIGFNFTENIPLFGSSNYFKLERTNTTRMGGIWDD